MAVELALTPDGRWDVSWDTYLDAARRAGFDHIGLSEARATELPRGALPRFGLGCHEILSLRVGRGGDMLEAASRLAHAAASVGAPWVLTGGFRGALSDQTLANLSVAADVIAAAGARLAVEFSPAGPVNSIPTALSVVDALGARRAAVLIDSWHFFHGPSTWDDLTSIPLERIAYIQFTDASAPISDDGFDETMNRRAMPGEGVLDLGRFAQTLLSRGWEGVVSLEVLSRELNQLPLSEFARRARESAAAFWL